MANDTQLAIRLEARIRDFERNMTKAERKADRTYKQLTSGSSRAAQRVEANMTRMARATQAAAAASRTLAGAFGLGALTAGVAALPALMRSVVSEMSNIGKVADKVGLTTEAIQELRYGFELAGVAANQTDTVMQRFARRVAEAAAGAGELRPILEANGLAIRNQDGSMRSQIDILRDYANLIKNAGSSQEQLLLAFKAFDTEGAALVNALRKGSDGLDDLMRAARDAGAVVEDELIRKAEETDDKFAALQTRLMTFAKREVLIATDNVRGLGGEFTSLRDSITGAWSAFDGFWNSMTGRDPVTAGKDKLRAALIQQQITGNVPDGFSLADMDMDNGTKGPRIGVEPAQTVIPDKGNSGASSRDAAARAAEREREAVDRLIEGLEEEYRLINATAAEREISSALRQAGAAATEEERQQIRSLIMAINAEEAALRKAAEAQQEMRDLSRDVLGSFVSDLRSGVSAADALENSLGRVADRLINMALDQSINALFGGGGGGGLRSLLGGFGNMLPGSQWSIAAGGGVGLYKDGGYTGTGGKHQPAGVVHKGEYVFDQEATRRIGVGNLARLHKGYADGGLVGAPRIPSLRQAASPSASSGGDDVNITIDVRGAQGNAEIQSMVQAGVRQGLAGYDKRRRLQYRGGGQPY